MKLLCITPTYGRDVKLLQNCLACFNSQTYDNAYQIYLDDTYDGDAIRGDRFAVLQTKNRFNNLSVKHNYAVELGTSIFGKCDAIVIWDDDDIYLPNHLENVVRSLENEASFSYSSSVYMCLDNEQTPKVDPTGYGRFHGNIAFTEELYCLNKWNDTLRMDFDHKMIQGLIDNGVEFDRSDLGHPTYVYRWSTSGEHHCSGVSTGPGDENWYFKTPNNRQGPLTNLEPSFDENTLIVRDYLKQSQL
tara:strand:+ start:1323 stop:2060 length:738 start_codon:yes stop_codon:yes gene_type:complete